jgi:hypothetical protein
MSIMNHYHEPHTTIPVPSWAIVRVLRDGQRDVHVMHLPGHTGQQPCPTWRGRNEFGAEESSESRTTSVGIETTVMRQDEERRRSVEVR